MSYRSSTPATRAGHAGTLALCCLFSCSILAQAVRPDGSSSSEERLRRLLQQTPATPAVSPESRAKLLHDGEAALSRGEIEQAAAAFEQAGFVKHAADAELGLIRAYMQWGQYRRALAFAAHTAGAHPEVGAGAGLYAWLLHLGGQSQVAVRLLQRARDRLPGDPLLDATQLLMTSTHPITPAALLQPPARFAPYHAPSVELPAVARAIASGVLIDDGHAVLSSRFSVDEGVPLWVRDGLGRVREATRDHTRNVHDAVVLRLSTPLEAPRVATALRDPHPGSPAMAIEFVSGSAATQPERAHHASQDVTTQPAWPILRIGFLGSPRASLGHYRLGVALPPGPRGGPVFDAAGRLIGIAVASADGDTLLAPSALRASVPGLLADHEPTPPRIALDELYERALRQTVQIITVR